jgi:hypothetical protein
MTPLATIIGVATITGVETRENPDSRMIYTYYSLNFSEVWKGTPADPAVLQQAGGKLGDRVVAIAGRAFKFETGDTIVLFAHESPQGPYVLIGINQGGYRMIPGADRPLWRLSEPSSAHRSLALPLAELKRQVCAAMGVPYQPPGAAVPHASERRPEPRPAPVPGEVPRASEPERRAVPEEAGGRGLGPVIAAALVAAAVLAILLAKNKRSKLMK